MADLLNDTQTLSKIQSDYAQSQEGIKNVDYLSSTENTYTPATQQQMQNAGASIKDASTYIKPETTVAGQLSSLLNSNSDYMKQVDAKSKMTANQVGMLSSDRYVGAAVGAATREALPIAQQDAESATKLSIQQQQGENAIANVAAEGLVSGALKTQEAKLAQVNAKAQSLMDSYSNAGLTTMKAQWQYATEDALKKLENQLNKDYIAADYNQQTAENTRAQAASQIENTMISIENILKDPDILQLGSDAVAQIIDNQIALMRSSVELTYNLAKLNPDNYITGLLDNFADEYDWSAI